MHWGEPTGAPVSGEVFGLTVHAPQEVVRPGEPILQIVPEDAGLVVMARLNPIDVDQVYPGQAAVLRFSAFPARVTPEFEGYVMRVSPDAMRDAETGLSWYEVELGVGPPVRGDRDGRNDGRAGSEPGGRASGADPLHAGGGPYPHRGALGDELPYQAGDGLLLPLIA